MNYFQLNKYQTVEENIPYSAMILYKLLYKKMTVDELLKSYSKENDIDLNLNLERILLLSLTFLYSIGKIEFKNDLIARCYK